MSNKRYTVIGEKPESYQCTNDECRWIGQLEDKAKVKNDLGHDLVCPQCGNSEFYGLISDEQKG